MSYPLREARISLDTLHRNLEIFQKTASNAQVLVIAKANAYGHGLIPFARAAAETGAWIGLADIAEALTLRSAGIRVPLLAWLHGSSPDFASAAEADIDLAVSTLPQLEAAAAVSATVHLKIDTGLSRNGVALEEADKFFALAASLARAGRLRVRGLMSHLSGTSPTDDLAQLELFDRLVQQAQDAGLRPELRHIASTLATLTLPKARYELVRIGAGAYGINPATTLDISAWGVRPVMRLVSQVAAVRRAKKDTGVSYGYTHRVSEDTTLALVPLGYADGIPRQASGRAWVSVNGVHYKQVGRIAMDQFLIDVGDDQISLGDEVVLWGNRRGEPTADDWGEWASTIGYDIVTRLGARVHRVYQ